MFPRLQFYEYQINYSTYYCQKIQFNARCQKLIQDVALKTNDSVMEIPAWTQKHFQKPLIVNTVHCAILKMDWGKVENSSVVR